MSGPQQHAIEQRILTGTTFLGVPAQKNPCDAWVYQEIIHETRPDVIVEVGNRHGGSLLYLASICDMIGHGEVVGVDVSREGFDPRAGEHERVRLVNGTAVEAFFDVQVLTRFAKSVLVIEDSAHTYAHTSDVLRRYGSLVRHGGYMICEDGVMPEVARALDEFLDRNAAWEVDRAREWPFTWNPGGFLRRVSA